MIILFDLDGTLIDSRADLADAVNQTRSDYGFSVRPLPEIVACVGDGVKLLIRRAIPELPPELLDEAVARNKINYRARMLNRTTLYPGIAETVRTLAATHCLGVVTNKPGEFAEPILAELGIADCFKAIVGGGDAPLLKPDPAPLRLAAERIGRPLAPSDWMIGDHVVDLEAGRSAGIKTCFCSYGFGETRDCPHDLSISDPRQLLKDLPC